MKLQDKWKWAARDNDDEWCLYSSKPEITGNCWGTVLNDHFVLGDLMQADSFPDCDWKDSLHQIIDGELVKYIDLRVDDKVMVTDNSEWVKRYFSHFAEDGTINCFLNGRTSWMGKTTNEWNYWRLPTKEELS